jgi:hypothetical protein
MELMTKQQVIDRMRHIATPADVKHFIRKNSNYFDRKTMSFFGDTMSNFKISKTYSIVKSYDGTKKAAMLVHLYRKQRTSNGAPAGLCASFTAGDDYRLTRAHFEESEVIFNIPLVSVKK